MKTGKSELKWVRKFQEEAEREKEQTFQITDSPEYKEMQKRMEQLRVEISMAIQERDHLVLHECKNIESGYLLKFGALEYQVYSLECDYLRLKRKLELIIAKRNRQEEIILQEIDDILEEEFQEYLKILEEKMGQINDALKWKQGTPLSEEDAKELKSLYRKIVKKLHPDIHKENTDVQNELFLRAVEAYERGDLQALQIIADMVFTDVTEDGFLPVADLQNEIVRMEASLDKIRKTIEKIKEQYPYILKKYLEDDAVADKHMAELEQAKEEYQTRVSIYEEEIRKYLAGE